VCLCVCLNMVYLRGNAFNVMGSLEPVGGHAILVGFPPVHLHRPLLRGLARPQGRRRRTQILPHAGVLAPAGTHLVHKGPEGIGAFICQPKAILNLVQRGWE
jgi:hypothetical protein